MPSRTAAIAALSLVLGAVLSAEGQETRPRAPRRAANPAMAPITDDPALPRVLLIGDSISIGYTLPTRELLKGAANVHRIPVNGSTTTFGLEHIDEWLGSKPWDVIHFNWGLHDLKYMNAQGQLADPASGKQQVPLEQYEANLRKLVERLKKTDAVLIWRSTTPVPEGSQGRVPGDEVRYNEVAKKIMQEHEIAIDDQHAFALARLAELQRPANVHFTDEGSAALAAEARRHIRMALEKKTK